VWEFGSSSDLRQAASWLAAGYADGCDHTVHLQKKRTIARVCALAAGVEAELAVRMKAASWWMVASCEHGLG
jgi:hypothetical protein